MNNSSYSQPRLANILSLLALIVSGVSCMIAYWAYADGKEIRIAVSQIKYPGIFEYNVSSEISDEKTYCDRRRVYLFKIVNEGATPLPVKSAKVIHRVRGNNSSSLHETSSSFFLYKRHIDNIYHNVEFKDFIEKFVKDKLFIGIRPQSGNVIEFDSGETALSHTLGAGESVYVGFVLGLDKKLWASERQNTIFINVAGEEFAASVDGGNYVSDAKRAGEQSSCAFNKIPVPTNEPKVLSNQN